MNKEKPLLIRVLTRNGVDFVILFLAITLGFFADNIREEWKADESAGIMAADLVQDLNADTVTIHNMLGNAYTKGRKLDSLYELLNSGDFLLNDSLLYCYSAYVNRRILFERHNSSYTLLLSTGLLRYFSKESGAAITQYDVDCQAMRDLLVQERTLLNDKIFPFQQQVFDIDNFHSVMNGRPFAAKPVLHNWNAESCRLYRNYVSELIVLNQYIIGQYRLLLASANRTRAVITKEFGES